jgi:hypothetical protein
MKKRTKEGTISQPLNQRRSAANQASHAANGSAALHLDLGEWDNR